MGYAGESLNENAPRLNRVWGFFVTAYHESIAKDIAHALAAPDLCEWLAKHGADPMSMTQPEFARFVLSESESAARIIKTAGIKIQP